MRILIAVHYFFPHVGGIEIVAENQAKYLAKYGHQVSVLTSAIDFKKGQYLHEGGYEVNRIPAWNYFEKSMGVPFPIYSFKLITEAYNEVKRADVVHIHDAFYLSSLITAFWAWVLHKPLFLTQHVAKIPHNNKLVGHIQDIVYRTSGRFIFSRSYKIIVINSRVRDFLINKHVDAGKIVTITNGTDLTLFHPASPAERQQLRKKYGLPTRKILALFVGRFVPKKGFDTLLEATSDQYELVFAGGNTPKRYVENKHYQFMGKLSQRQLAEIYRACDVFVLPSKGEGFPLSIQEAMASGLPVITTDDEGYAIYNFDRELFRLIDPTVARIKSELNTVAQDSDLRNAMSVYSHAYAKNHFSWDAAVNATTNLYRQIES